MPNWCNNSIEISGPADKIQKLFDAATTSTDTGLLHAMVAMPAELKGTTSPSDGENWYSWCVSNWGTKWEVDSSNLEIVHDTASNTASIYGWFDSAWAPPIAALVSYGEQNTDVQIELFYNEPGMAFCGKLTVADGEADDDYQEYDGATSEDVRELIGAELDDFFCISEDLASWEEEN